MNSQEIVADAVVAFWSETYQQDVIAFFSQKYDFDTEWTQHAELVEWDGHWGSYDMVFHNDFCEGQTCVKDITIVPLHEVTAYYAEHQLPHNGEKAEANYRLDDEEGMM